MDTENKKNAAEALDVSASSALNYKQRQRVRNLKESRRLHRLPKVQWKITTHRGEVYYVMAPPNACKARAAAVSMGYIDRATEAASTELYQPNTADEQRRGKDIV